jgi:hypothetical protein
MRLFWVIYLILFGVACGTPVGVKRIDPQVVHRTLTRNVLSSGDSSIATQNVLRRWNLFQLFTNEPENALATMHTAVVEGRGGADEVAALAELSFLHAEATGNRAYYLASAVYALAFLFPEQVNLLPNPYDPRMRLTCDLYNRSVTAAFETQDGSEVELRSGEFALPFGQLEVKFDANALQWGDRKLVHFLPVAELEVYGLRNRYRRPGIGAPLAASTEPLDLTKELQDFVSSEVKTPVTALLRVENPLRQLTQKRLYATLELYAASDTESVSIEGQLVP